MSWDLFVMRLPKGLTNIEELPPDHVAKPLGKRASLIRKLHALVPGLEFDEAGGATVAKPRLGSIEITLGRDDPVQSVMLAVRGSKHVIPMVAAIVDALGGRAVDATSPSGLFDPKTAGKSLGSVKAYAGKVVASARKTRKKSAAKKRRRSTR
jgi:hypothetical protein